jgi:hypothetical protein
MVYNLLCLQYKNTPAIKKAKQSLLKFIIMKNMDAFDLMNINMTTQVEPVSATSTMGFKKLPPIILQHIAISSDN